MMLLKNSTGKFSFQHPLPSQRNHHSDTRENLHERTGNFFIYFSVCSSSRETAARAASSSPSGTAPAAPRPARPCVSGAAVSPPRRPAAPGTSSAGNAVASRLRIGAAPRASLRLGSAASAAFSPCRRHAAPGTSSAGSAGSFRRQIFAEPAAAPGRGSVASSASVRRQRRAAAQVRSVASTAFSRRWRRSVASIAFSRRWRRAAPRTCPAARTPSTAGTRPRAPEHAWRPGSPLVIAVTA